MSAGRGLGEAGGLGARGRAGEAWEVLADWAEQAGSREASLSPVDTAAVLQFKGYVWTASAVGDRSTSGGQTWTHCLSRAPSLLDLWQ